jgi:RNA polymerase sigma factor (TIGR02999 family)
MSEVTRILDAIGRGEKQAADLLHIVYDELRKVAAHQLSQEKPGQTLQPTALVHEAYLRLVGPANAEGFKNKRHFVASAAQAMRRILVDNARSKLRLKRGGNRVSLELADNIEISSDEELLKLDEALTQLTDEDAHAARVVELRYFAGLGHEQIAAHMQITVYQARQKWTYARAWLRDAMNC